MICALGGLPLGAWLGGLCDRVEPLPENHAAGVEMAHPKARTVSRKQLRPTMEQILEANGWEQFRLIARFLPDASKDEVQALLVVPKFERDSWRLLLARWCELAPLECLVWVRKDKELGDLEQWCFYAWAQVDAVAAMAEAEKGSNGSTSVLAVVSWHFFHLLRLDAD